MGEVVGSTRLDDLVDVLLLELYLAVNDDVVTLDTELLSLWQWQVPRWWGSAEL